MALAVVVASVGETLTRWPHLQLEDEVPPETGAIEDLTRLTRLGLQYNFFGRVPECISAIANLVSLEHMYAAQLVTDRLYIGTSPSPFNSLLLFL